MKLLCIGGPYHNEKVELQTEDQSTLDEVLKFEHEGFDYIYFVHRIKGNKLVLIYRDLDFHELISFFVTESTQHRTLIGKRNEC